MSILVGELAAILELGQAEDCDEVRSILYADMGTVHAALSSSDIKSSLNDIIYDVGAVRTLLAAGIAEQTPRSGDVITAKDHLMQANRLAILAKAFDEPLGIELMAPVEALEEQGASTLLASTA